MLRDLVPILERREVDVALGCVARSMAIVTISLEKRPHLRHIRIAQRVRIGHGFRPRHRRRSRRKVSRRHHQQPDQRRAAATGPQLPPSPIPKLNATHRHHAKVNRSEQASRHKVGRMYMPTHCGSQSRPRDTQGCLPTIAHNPQFSNQPVIPGRSAIIRETYGPFNEFLDGSRPTSPLTAPLQTPS